ncbi:MAG: C-terminal binding protein [Acetivibrionales bacterium]|jgi:D-3-phosphoglycerate dehydrogenase
MPKFKVVVTDDRHGSYDVERSVLSAIGAEVVVANCETPEDVLEACRDADGIMANLAPMPAQVIQGLNKCKVIARYGVGYDNVDVEACTKKGIYLANVPDYCAEDVSDHALALLLGCVRKIARRDAQVRQGQWNIGKADPVYRITGKTFAFLGYGMIAQCLHRKIKGLNLGRVLVYDPFLDAGFVRSQGAEPVDFETALKESDYISIHMPLNEKTRGIIGEEAFAMMKPTAIIVNTSRGPIIDEAALIKALSEKRINSAGLDVFTKEPLDKDSPLMKLENCILTDHMGWYSEEAMEELKRKTAENVRDVLLGGKPKYPVNEL